MCAIFTEQPRERSVLSEGLNRTTAYRHYNAAGGHDGLCLVLEGRGRTGVIEKPLFRETTGSSSRLTRGEEGNTRKKNEKDKIRKNRRLARVTITRPVGPACTPGCLVLPARPPPPTPSSSPVSAGPRRSGPRAVAVADAVAADAAAVAARGGADAAGDYRRRRRTWRHRKNDGGRPSPTTSTCTASTGSSCRSISSSWT